MKLFASISLFLMTGLLYAAPLQKVVIFGDSLSDNGNLYRISNHELPPSPPYFQGHFTNGKVWIENLVATFFSVDPESHLQDFACGGAVVSSKIPTDNSTEGRIQNLYDQLKQYFTQLDHASEDTLYVLWIGANNYFNIPEDFEPVLQEVIQGTQNSLEFLVHRGAKNIMVVNLPDLGQTPDAIEDRANDPSSSLSSRLTLVSEKHNEMLRTSFDTLQSKYPDVKWVFFDVNRIFKDVISNPASYGFSNVTQTCPLEMNKLSLNANKKVSNKRNFVSLISTIPPQVPVKCEGYLFFDPVHPTAAAHQQIAVKAIEALENAGIYFGN